MKQRPSRVRNRGAVTLVAWLSVAGWSVTALGTLQAQERPQNQASQDAPRCVVLQSSPAALEGFPQVLADELGGRGVAVLERGQDQGCTPVNIESIAGDVAVIEVPGQRARVVELAPIEPHLRARSLALAVAEEIHASEADAPPLRAAPDPTDPVEPPPEPIEADPGDHSTPPSATSGHALLVGAKADYAFDTSQPFFGGWVGLDLDLGLAAAGTLRLGANLELTSKNTNFGTVDSFVVGGFLGWNWRFLQSSGWGLSVSPQAEAGAVLSQAEANAVTVVNRESATRGYLRFGLGLYFYAHLSESIFLELGPLAQLTPDPPQSLGDGEVVAGFSTLSVGGRLSLAFGF